MFPQLTEQDLYKLSTSQLLPLGTKFVSDQARKTYKYVQFGNTASLTSGILVVAPAAPANSTGLALDSSNTTTNLSFGSKQLIVDNGSTAVTANQFQDGSLEVLGANGYSSYRIAGNSAAPASGTITVSLSEPLRNSTALVVGTNTVNLRQNPASGATSSLTQAEAVGVTILPVTYTAGVTNYGWVQIGGDCVVFATSGTKGDAISQDTAGTAGYVINAAGATSQILGVAQESVGSSLLTVNLSIA